MLEIAYFCMEMSNFKKNMTICNILETAYFCMEISYFFKKYDYVTSQKQHIFGWK